MGKLPVASFGKDFLILVVHFCLQVTLIYFLYLNVYDVQEKSTPFLNLVGWLIVNTMVPIDVFLG